MKDCQIHNCPLKPVGMQLVCMERQRLYERAGFSIDLRHIF